MTTTASESAAPQRKRRWHQFSLRTLFLVATAAAATAGLAKWYYRSPPVVYRTLPEILEDYRGWDLVQGPDQPGPYAELGASCAGRGCSVSGGFWHDGKNRTFSIPGVPGEEFRVLELASRKDGPTFVVLRLGPASVWLPSRIEE